MFLLNAEPKWNKSDSERQIPRGFTYIENIKNKTNNNKKNNKSKFIDTEKRLVVARGEGR